MDLFHDRSAVPMLIAQMQSPFDHENWIYELKLDGFRCIAYLDDGVDLRNKRKMKVLGNFPELGRICEETTGGNCILDGEVVVLKNGKPDFYELQRRTLLTDPFKIKTAAKLYPASFVAYDCLYHNGKEYFEYPLMKRKEILSGLVKYESPRFSCTRFIQGKGKELYEAAWKQELEGVVAKRMDSEYFMGKRSKDWVKFKRMADEDFIVAGYIPKAANTYSIIMAKYGHKKELIYKGHVTAGVKKHHISILRETGENPFQKLPTGSGNEQAVWVAIEVVCVVEYMPNLQNYIRQPTFKGFRDDVLPEEVRISEISITGRETRME